jgi:phosphatidylserine synthase 2
MKTTTGETNGEWQKKKLTKLVEDDGTLTFFWREHTVLFLLVMCAMLTYVAIFEESNEDPDYNKKRGIISCAFFFVLFGITQSPNGPFIRPHPAFWKLILVLSVLYEIFLVYLLFQVSIVLNQTKKNLN